ncbi:MAG: hypothetical protein ACUZ8O_11335 [Candidatus Anammoxibacter sp.]
MEHLNSLLIFALIRFRQSLFILLMLASMMLLSPLTRINAHTCPSTVLVSTDFINFQSADLTFLQPNTTNATFETFVGQGIIYAIDWTNGLGDEFMGGLHDISLCNKSSVPEVAGIVNTTPGPCNLGDSVSIDVRKPGVTTISFTWFDVDGDEVDGSCSLTLTVVGDDGLGTIKGQLKSTALVETTDGNGVQNATVELFKQDSRLRERNVGESIEEYQEFLDGEEGRTSIDSIVVQPSDMGSFSFDGIPVSDSESNDIFYTIEVSNASSEVVIGGDSNRIVTLNFSKVRFPLNVMAEEKEPFTVHEIHLSARPTHTCPSTLIVIDGGREGGVGPGGTLSMTEVEINGQSASITNPGVSVQYIIAGDGRATSAVSFIRQNTVGVISGGDDIVIDISPRVILDATDQVYTISTLNFGSAVLSWQWNSLDPDCVANCFDSCFLALDVTAFDPFAPTDDDVSINLSSANNFADGAIGGLGEALDILLSMPDEPVAEPEATQIDNMTTIVDESIDLIESVVPELAPIVVLASVSGENLATSSLAPKNSTTDDSELIESLELAVTNYEQAIASLEQIEEGMLAGDAIPLLEDAIVSLETGQTLIQSVIVELGEDDGNDDDDDDDGGNDGTMGCAGSSSLGIPQTRPMKKLMNKLKDRIESNWSVDHDYIELFNDNKKELTQIVKSHPALAYKLRSERTRLMPSILLLIFGEPVELSTTDVKRIDAILDTITAFASPQLEDAIDQIRSDLHSEEVLSSFGISVE